MAHERSEFLNMQIACIQFNCVDVYQCRILSSCSGFSFIKWETQRHSAAELAWHDSHLLPDYYWLNVLTFLWPFYIVFTHFVFAYFILFIVMPVSAFNLTSCPKPFTRVFTKHLATSFLLLPLLQGEFEVELVVIRPRSCSFYSVCIRRKARRHKI